ncbi:MAG: Hsp20/alpha crystallin family protein [Deltaproteobacteria bacterium]|jgi:HSP20 family protein|nr:Hsp20/alpha crystallin family protein [Deltaproteobacteria bacterium]
MTLNKWDPLKDLLNLQETAQRILGASTDEGRRKRRVKWFPVVDIFETPDAYVFRAELPGVGKDNISVEVHGSTLTLSGERFIESDPRIAVYHRIERTHGGFERAFTLPGQVNVDKVEATYVDGVLEVMLPKTPEDCDRTISIVCSG